MSAPIRVAQVVGKMVGGGVEQVVMNYYRHIDRSRVQFDFLVDSDSTLVPRDEIESLGGRVFEIPPYQHPFAYRCALVRLFRKERWPIAHSHINALSVFPLSAAKAAGVPVRIAHSHSTSGRGEHAKNAVKAVLKRFSNIYPTHRMACSCHAGEWLFGKGTDFKVIPNAIELERFAFDPASRVCLRAELGATSSTLVIGHIGRFTEQKNHRFLIDVFAELRRAHPDSLLVLAGEGPLRSEIEHRVKNLNLTEFVRFLSQRSDVNQLYSAFDVFCLPSLYEGLPVVGIECQASGTPVLFSSSVSQEVQVTSLAEFESLASGVEIWSERLLSIVNKEPSSKDLSEIAAFDVSLCAGHLCDYYVKTIRV